MFLAIPGRIKSIETKYDGLVRVAKVSFGGITKEASLEMLPDADIDDYVLVHVGFALNKISQAEARRTLEIMNEAGVTPEELV